MKLLSLNLWGGTQGNLLFDYLKQQSAEVDIFCFQEVFCSGPAQADSEVKGRMDLYAELCALLPEYVGYFEMTSKNHDLVKLVDFAVDCGQAVFVKKGLKVLTSDCAEIYGNRGESLNPSAENLPAALQRMEISSDGKKLQIYNFHGITYPGEKLDSPERIEQSKKILSVMAGSEGHKILCGDFNLTPQTQSIGMLGETMKDLIKEYKIENTRNEISWKQYHNIQHFADFTFVSPEVKVESFEVPYNEVSDHLPMILGFAI